jgi:hypothetical protein
LDYLSKHSAITRRQESQQEVGGYYTQAFSVKEGTPSQGMQTAPGSWKNRGSPAASGGSTVLLQNYEIINLYCVKPVSSWYFVTATIGN